MIPAEEIQALLVNAGICGSKRDLVGYDEEIIALHEERFGHAFPAQYRELLRAVGLSAPGFFDGTSLFNIDLTADARSALADSGDALPEGAWVFSMHGGYQFDWFKSSGGDDPPVHKWIEEEPMKMNVWPSLSNWFHDSVAWHLQFKR